MPETFQYKVKDKNGKLVEGSLEAENAQLVVSKLRSMGYVPIEIQQSGGASLQRDLKIPGLSDRVKLKEVAVFSRQFATMINSGLSLLRSLNILAEQTESKALAEIVNQVRMDVEKGSSLSQAMAKHPKAFGRLYVSMVRAGEVGGALDSVLMRLADTMEKQVELRRKVKSAMTYPLVVAILVLTIVTAMLLFVIPMFQGIYKQLGGTLPPPTQFLINVSNICRKLWYIIFLVEIGGGVRIQALDQLRRRSQAVGRDQAEGPDLRQARAQDGARAVLAYPLCPCALGCPHPRVARHRGRDRRQLRGRQGGAGDAVGGQAR